MEQPPRDLFGGVGNDSLEGGSGNDALNGDAGNDLLTGDAGNDAIDGDSGNDTVLYQTSLTGVVVNLNSISYSSEASPGLLPFTIAANTALDGFGTTDTLLNIENMIGSGFADILIGSDTANVIQGLAGNDFLVGNAGNDRLDGGGGNDTISYQFDPSAVTVNLEMTSAIDGWGNTDQLISIETVIGSAFNDFLMGDNQANLILAGAGNDTVFARAGNDTLVGGFGNDRLDGGTGNDIIDGGVGDDTLSGGGRRDRFILRRGDGIDMITDFGGVGRSVEPSPAIIAETDILQFEGEGLIAKNMLLTQTGNSLEVAFEGIAETKVILQNFALENLDNLGQGNGSINLGNIAFLFNSQTQITDSFDVFNAEWQNGNPGGSDRRVLNPNTVTFLNNFNLNNTIQGFDNSDDVINGQGGNDILLGLSGDDILRGGTGNDTLIGGLGKDSLTGDDGNDLLYGQDWDDFLIGGRGNDSGVDSSSTWIKLNSTGETLMTFNNVQASALTR
ncbi:calcium-binding protein [Phormidesmis priestleyi]